MDVANYVNPKAMDFVLPDFTEHEAQEVAMKIFQFPINSPAEQAPTFPIEGYIWGLNSRLLMPFTVSDGNKAIKTLGLYSSSCPYTFLCKTTLQELGLGERIAETTNLQIHGQMMPVHLSHS